MEELDAIYSVIGEFLSIFGASFYLFFYFVELHPSIQNFWTALQNPDQVLLLTSIFYIKKLPLKVSTEVFARFRYKKI